MRRLVQHAAVGLGCTALAIGAAVAGVGKPAESVLAVPAPAPAVTVGSGSTPSAPVDRTEPDLGSEGLVATAVEQAGRRTAALASESRSINRQQVRIVSGRRAAAAAKKARLAKAKARADSERARSARRRAEADRERAQLAAAAAAEERGRLERVKAQGYDPGTTSPREMARQILQNRFGYGAAEFSCFDSIIMRESNWDIDATNPSSGAYGIPQALPGSKMATVAGDWRTNPATQIIWAVGYMKDRYGSPCSAWSFKSANGWY